MAELNFNASEFEQGVPPYHNQTQELPPIPQQPVSQFIAPKTSQQLLYEVSESVPSEESIIAYLRTLYAELIARGVDATPVEQFYSTDALAIWFERIAQNKEYTEVEFPPHIDCRSLRGLLYGCLEPFYCPELQKQITTFYDRVERGLQRLEMWLSSSDDELAKVARRKRTVRVGNRRRSLVLSAAVKKPEELTEAERHALAVRKAYDEFRTACDERKKSAEHWSQAVAEKQRVWEELRKVNYQ